MTWSDSVSHRQGREVCVGNVDGAECQEVRHTEQQIGGQPGGGGQLPAQHQAQYQVTPPIMRCEVMRCQLSSPV